MENSSNQIVSWKDGDVYLWSFNDQEYEKRKDHHDMYWCCSRIGIVANEFLVDTYWGSSLNKMFTIDDVNEKLVVAYKGNLNDYTPCRKEDQAMYNDEDILNLSHPNSSNQYYLRIGALKSKEKMVKVIKRNALKLQHDIEYAKSSLTWELDKLNNLDTLNYTYGLDGVSLEDVSYVDENFHQLELNKE